MSVAPFPWDQLARAGWDESEVAAWCDAAGLRWRATVTDATEVGRRLREPSAARLGVRWGEVPGVAIVPWPAWRAIARRVLGDDGELAAPRPPTLVERAFAAVAVAAVVPDAIVELEEPRLAATRIVEVDGEQGSLALALARAPALAARPLAALIARRGARLPEVTVALELARGRLRPPVELRPRDVVVVGKAAPRLRVGPGEVTVALDPHGPGLIVLSPYRPAAMTASDDALGHELSVPLTLVVADLSVSARRLLELAPGQVLATGRAVGTQVELRAGARVVARGELVTVDGDLGVRVTEVVEAAPAGELVAPPAPMVVPAPR